MIKKVFVLFILGCLVLPLEAQNTSTQGKEFWLSFMHNGFKDHDLGGWVINQVLISAKRDCSGTISNPLTGWSREFSVSANNITTVEIPNEQGYHGTNIYETITQKGIKIQANDTISVYCTNIAYVSFDASFVLPIESLGDEYIIQSYDQSRDGSSNAYVYNNETSALLIVATEDNTEIEITPSVATLGGRPANETFSITMNAGETYHLRSTRYGTERDLSGTHILAADCKRIAIFNGNTVTCIPINMGNGYDHVFEQAMPLRSWGKKFVVTSSRNRNRDFIKITSSANNNIITKNGDPLITLMAGDSHTFDMDESEGSCFLEANQPCAVYLYNNSSYDQSWMGGLGDPSMVWIAPVEQRINDVTFSTFDHPNINIETHSVNIIVNTEDVANVYFDGQQISPLLFNHVNGNNNYKYARMDISHGVHRISCVNGFNAHVYGFGDAKGYAYLVGSNAINLSSSLTLNDDPVLPNESYSYCANQPITFRADINLPNFELLWDFGDGTTSNENPVVHTYENGRIYDVSVAITTDEGGCTGSSSNTTNFIVDTRQQYIIESDVVCEGELYTGYGFNDVHIIRDTTLVRLQDNPIHSECQDSVLVYITALPNYHIPVYDSRCWHGDPGVYDAYGFSFVYDHPDTYEYQNSLQTIYGCDSIITLHLTVSDIVYGDTTAITCGSFTWYEHEYTETPYVAPTHTFVSAAGCDSIVTLHLTISEPEHGDTTATACDSFTWYGQEYTETPHEAPTYSLVNAAGCDSIVSLHLTLIHTPTPKISCGTPGAVVYGPDHDTVAVVTSTEYFSFQYDFYVEDEREHFDDWDSCKWSISKLSWSIESIPNPNVNEPNRHYCRVYVAEHDDNIVELYCTIYHHCKQILDSITTTFYLKSSFLVIDEQDAAQTDFNITPNPNNGQIMLNFINLTGRIDIKVFNMQGILIDNIQTYNTSGDSSFTYDMKPKAKGLYLFVVNGKEGTLTKKIVISP